MIAGITEKIFNEQWITDVIGDDYKDWNSKYDKLIVNPERFIFLESNTGTGKTTFVLDTLLEKTKERRDNILYLCNRTALMQQVEKKITEAGDNGVPLGKKLPPYHYESDLAKSFVIGDDESVITVANYQGLLGFRSAYKYKYVVVDEAHFFFDDSLFNPMTCKIFENILMMFRGATFLITSATIRESVERLYHVIKRIYPYPIVQLYRNEYQHKGYNLYFYQKDETLLSRIAGSPAEEKWLVFVHSKKEGRQLKKDIESRTSCKVVTLDATKKSQARWRELVEKERFSAIVLIATKVIDNGVNINDEQVKHVVLPFACEGDFIQMLGRRRCKADEEINVYAKVSPIQHVNSQLNQFYRLKEAMEQAFKIRNDPSAKTAFLRKLWLNGNNNINSLFYLDNNRYLVRNELACYKVQNLIEFYGDLSQNYKDVYHYPRIVKKWMGLEGSEPEFLDSDGFVNLDDFFQNYLGLKIEAEKQEKVYTTFQSLYEGECNKRFEKDSEKMEQAKNIRKGKTQRKATINRQLTMLDLPYKLIKRNNNWIFEAFDR